MMKESIFYKRYKKYIDKVRVIPHGLQFILRFDDYDYASVSVRQFDYIDELLYELVWLNVGDCDYNTVPNKRSYSIGFLSEVELLNMLDQYVQI